MTATTTYLYLDKSKVHVFKKFMEKKGHICFMDVRDMLMARRREGGSTELFSSCLPLWRPEDLSDQPIIMTWSMKFSRSRTTRTLLTTSVKGVRERVRMRLVGRPKWPYQDGREGG